MPFTLILCSSPGCLVSKQRAVYMSVSLSLCGCHPENTSLDSQPEGKVGLVFLDSMKWYQTKKQFLTGDSPRISIQRANRNAHLWSFCEICILYKCCLRVWLPISLHLSRCWLRSFPLGYWQGLAQLQPLWTTKNKVCCLDNHNGLRDIQELRQSWTITFLQEATPSRLGEMAALANV